jgi:hypothetical protein
MSKRTPQISVLTANRLGDGIVVFLDTDGAWVDGIESAAVARSPEESKALEAHGARDAARNLVVEPYLAEVREIGGQLVPIRARERVRVDGPSILGDVPGYASPSPRASSPSPRLRGQGRAEGQNQTAPVLEATPHPSPLPALMEREEGSAMRGERESAEAAC